MKEFDALTRIQELMQERGWSLYQLAKASGISYSTLNTMVNKGNQPTLPTLQKLCQGFGISMAAFFEPEQNTRGLTEEQSECLTLFTALSSGQRKLAIAYLKGLAGTL